jgi:hypothetical protein
VFFSGEALLPKKKKTVDPALNTEMEMHSELITFLSEKIMLEEMGAIRRIDQNMEYEKKKQHETGKAEKKKTRYLFYV